MSNRQTSQLMGNAAMRLAGMRLVRVCGIVLLGFSAVQAQDQEPAAEVEFYRGKSISVYSGNGASDADEAYARLVARHLGDHIDASPSVIYRGKQGGSVIGFAKWLKTKAPKDGLHIAIIDRRVGLYGLTGPSKVGVTGLDFTWLMALGRSVPVCFSWAKSGIRSLKDAKYKTVTYAAAGDRTKDAVFARLMNTTIGTRFRIVHGYNESDLFDALEEGDVHASCGISYSRLRSLKSRWLRRGRLKIFAQFGARPHRRLAKVPLLITVAKTDDDKRAIALVASAGEWGRPFVAPPSIPEPQRDTLRKAFKDMVRDDDFVDDGDDKDLVIRANDGARIEVLQKSLHGTSRAVRKRVRALLIQGADERRRGRTASTQ